MNYSEYDFKSELRNLYKKATEKNYEPIYEAIKEAALKGEPECLFYDEQMPLALTVAKREGLKSYSTDTQRDDYVKVWGWAD